MTAQDEARDAVRALEELALRPDDAPDSGALEASAWTVTDERSAAWALAKIRQARDAADRRNAPALAVIAELEEALAEHRATVDANNARAQATADWFTIHLTRWHREQYEADTDPKHRTTTSIQLPGGKLTSRQTPGKVLAVADPEALPEELREVEYKPKKLEITAWIKGGNEIPDGVEWEPPRRVYGVDV